MVVSAPFFQLLNYRLLRKPYFISSCEAKIITLETNKKTTHNIEKQDNQLIKKLSSCLYASEKAGAAAVETTSSLVKHKRLKRF